jgi:diguanylate cyclase (GGDEF)-like protein
MRKMLQTVIQKQNFMILLTGFVLLIYIFSLITVAYLSQNDLKVAAMEQFRLDTEKRAVAMSYFYSERKNDLKDLARSNELSVFFKNQALGMSMEYGLRVSLLAIADLFNRIVEEKKINQDRIYDWIVFVDDTGMLLAISQLAGQIEPSIDIKKFLTPGETDPIIITDLQGSNQQVLISIPYYFKNQYRGQLIARIAYQNLYKDLITVSPGTIRTWYVCTDTEKACLHIASQEPSLVVDRPLQVLMDANTGKTQLLDITWAADLTMETLAVRVSVQGTPFSLVSLAPTAEVFGHLAPRHLLLAMGLLALLVLWGALTVVRTNTQNLILKARYDETAKQQAILETRNEQLREEITKRQEGEAKLNHMAHHDPLTGLPNRMLFNDRLQHALQRAHREGHPLAVLFLDLDRFKNVNDTLGHPVGDLLLKTVARRLVSCLREQDTVARLGGDEFIALMEGPLESPDMALVAQRVLHTLSKPFDLGGHEIILTTSIGISFYPADGQDVTELVKNADTAMYRAKEQGRNNYQFYTAELSATAFERFALETSLRHALERREFLLYYQPQFSFETDRINSAEALIRWQRPQEEELVSPDKFIPLAEETGLIEAIGEWVLRTACAQAKAWQAAGLPAISMAVNLSSRQMMSNHLFEQIRKALQETGLEAQYLELEITESSIMQEPAKAAATLIALKALGVSLVIDDFGTGYSSMGYLKRFSVNKLKIDKSFVCDLPENTNDKAIIRAIIALGHSMQLKVSAEGVETEEQEVFLKAEGCDERQGYLLSKPVPAETFTELLQRTNTFVVARTVAMPGMI